MPKTLCCRVRCFLLPLSVGKCKFHSQHCKTSHNNCLHGKTGLGNTYIFSCGLWKIGEEPVLPRLRLVQGHHLYNHPTQQSVSIILRPNRCDALVTEDRRRSNDALPLQSIHQGPWLTFWKTLFVNFLLKSDLMDSSNAPTS